MARIEGALTRPSAAPGARAARSRRRAAILLIGPALLVLVGVFVYPFL